MSSPRLFSFCVWAVFLACLSLAFVRLYLAVSFKTPWLIVTTNTEEDLYPIWKFAHGLPVYNDPTQIPFSLSGYNWFFYDLYGAVAAFFLHLLHLGDVWLPNVARLLTLFFAFAGSAFYFTILRRNRALRGFCPAYLLAALSLIATLNPLFGFWVMSARPDVGSIAFELAAIFFVILFLHGNRLIFAALAGIAFYLAWSMKQTAVTGLIAATLTLLLYRRFAAGTLVIIPWIALVAFTFFLGGPVYHYCVLTAQTEFPIRFGDSPAVFFSAVVKMPLIPLALFILIADSLRLARHGKFASQPSEETLLLFSTAIALLLGLVAAGKPGAADNYFFPFSIWSGLWLLWVFPRLGQRYFSAACLFTTFLFLGGITLVFMGRAGMIDRRTGHHVPHLILAQKLRHFPTPVYVTDVYGDFPWIQTHPPYFVVAEMYATEEKTGAIPRSRSLESLMERGYFATIVAGHNSNLSEAELALYKLADHDSNYDYYIRK